MAIIEQLYICSILFSLKSFASWYHKIESTVLLKVTSFPQHSVLLLSQLFLTICSISRYLVCKGVLLPTSWWSHIKVPKNVTDRQHRKPDGSFVKPVLMFSARISSKMLYFKASDKVAMEQWSSHQYFAIWFFWYGEIVILWMILSSHVLNMKKDHWWNSSYYILCCAK